MAVVVGFIGKFPVAGMTYYNLHYLGGLQDLGYEIHYVERQNRDLECYDPNLDTMTNDPGYAVKYLEKVLAGIGVQSDRYSFLDREGLCHGSGWRRLETALDRADFVLTLADETWFDDLERCPRRAFIDGDPMFTQHGMLDNQSVIARSLAGYPTLFTIGIRIGKPDCTVPTAGRDWLTTRSVVSTRMWEQRRGSVTLPVTSLMHWGAAPDVRIDGQIYGHKNRELRRFMGLPQRTHCNLVLAVGGNPPRDELQANGWELTDPLEATRTQAAYQQFIAGSMADLGFAKHAYVASRSGWFSDRALCFLAAGRPVLHQDTGFSDWLPTGDGILSFSNEEEIVEGLNALEANYSWHCRAARAMAEEHFEAEVVLGRLLDDAGFR